MCAQMLTQAIAPGGCMDTVREFTESESGLWEKNPSLHQGVELLSVVGGPHAIPAELHPCPTAFKLSSRPSSKHRKDSSRPLGHHMTLPAKYLPFAKRMPYELLEILLFMHSYLGQSSEKRVHISL